MSVWLTSLSMIIITFILYILVSPELRRCAKKSGWVDFFTSNRRNNDEAINYHKFSYFFLSFLYVRAIQSFGMCPLKKTMGKGLECKESERWDREERRDSGCVHVLKCWGNWAPCHWRGSEVHVRTPQRCTIWNGRLRHLPTDRWPTLTERYLPEC